MSVSLADIKLYLRVTGVDEDALIAAQVTAAENYLLGKVSKTKRRAGTDASGADVFVEIADDPLFQQCVKLMVAHWYENRAVNVTGTIVASIKHTVDAIVAHIEMCGDYI